MNWSKNWSFLDLPSKFIPSVCRTVAFSVVPGSAIPTFMFLSLFHTKWWNGGAVNYRKLNDSMEGRSRLGASLGISWLNVENLVTMAMDREY